MSLPRGWEDLAKSGSVRRGMFRVVPSPARTPEGDVLYALDGGEHLHLLIPLAPGSRFTADEQSSGVQLIPRILEDGGTTTFFADLVCLKQHLAELFSRLADDVIQAINAEPSQPVSAAKRVLNRWRELFDKERATPALNASQLVGLFGELHVLEQLCAVDPSAVRAWTGPSQSKHDFHRTGTALEVKSTAADDTNVVGIHGIDQLESDPKEGLYMVVVALGVDLPGAVSVPTLVSRIRALGVNGLDFTNRLADAGYYDQDAPRYEPLKFGLREQRIFRIDGSFPRIIESSFASGRAPAGVLRVDYWVELSHAQPLAADASKDLLRSFAEAGA